jgi:hypothetical protein
MVEAFRSMMSEGPKDKSIHGLKGWSQVIDVAPTPATTEVTARGDLGYQTR